MKNYFSHLSLSSIDVSKYNNYALSSSDPAPMTTSPVPTSPTPQSPQPMHAPPEALLIASGLDIIKDSIRCFTEYKMCQEHEKTERKRITATLKAITYQIDANKEVYLKEMEKRFEERNKLYDLAHEAQKKALELEDKEMLVICYNLILNVYNKSLTSGSMIDLLGSY